MIKIIFNYLLLEDWKEIPGYEGRYSVSNLGRVRSNEWVSLGADGYRRTHRERIMKQNKNRKEYKMVSFRGGPRKSWAVHRLVLEVFKPDRDLSLHCNHIDHNKNNNSLDNLEWVTNLENQRLSWANGRKAKGGYNHATNRI